MLEDREVELDNHNTDLLGLGKEETAQDSGRALQGTRMKKRLRDLEKGLVCLRLQSPGKGGTLRDPTLVIKDLSQNSLGLWPPVS